MERILINELRDEMIVHVLVRIRDRTLLKTQNFIILVIGKLMPHLRSSLINVLI